MSKVFSGVNRSSPCSIQDSSIGRNVGGQWIQATRGGQNPFGFVPVPQRQIGRAEVRQRRRRMVSKGNARPQEGKRLPRAPQLKQSHPLQIPRQGVGGEPRQRLVQHPHRSGGSARRQFIDRQLGVGRVVRNSLPDGLRETTAGVPLFFRLSVLQAQQVPGSTGVGLAIDDALPKNQVASPMPHLAQRRRRQSEREPRARGDQDFNANGADEGRIGPSGFALPFFSVSPGQSSLEKRPQQQSEPQHGHIAVSVGDELGPALEQSGCRKKD